MNKTDQGLNASMPAELRLKRLSDIASKIKVDFNIPPRRYFRSGAEMIRMANVYYEEQSYEQAYMLFMKFITLFVEKIRDHPDLKSVPPYEVSANMKALKEAISLAEKIKTKLLNLYKEQHNLYLERMKQEEYERKRIEEYERKIREEYELKRKRSLEEENDIRHNKNNPTTRVPFIKQSNESTIKPVPHLPDELAMYNFVDVDPLDEVTQLRNEKPNIDRSTKPETLCNDSAGYNSFSSLRIVVIPSKMMRIFLVLAQKNTDNNIETCGILAGKLKHNRLVITHLLVPKQYGTPDSCSTNNEEELFAYQDSHNLITLGWIHTHPSQTAFLSSVDMHTHCSYQLMMSEAIAIVCAPKYNQTGFFCLTPNYGLDFIANCKQTDFHPHPTDPPLFVEAEHCELDNEAQIEVLDLRN